MAHHWEILFRTILIYFLIIVTFRLMGKREVGELSVFDLVVTIMLAELSSMAIENTSDHLIHTLIPVISIVSMQILFSFLSLKSKRFRDLLDGRPSIIINRGTIDEKTMKKQRYNFDDLLVQLREKNIRNISDVEFAILEPSGKLSVFTKESPGKKKKSSQGDITMPLIIDGIIQEENLRRINKTSFWLRQELKKQGAPEIRKISFCSYDQGEFYIDKQDKS
ncbi:DUF421 domain-containing protein [Neobacillus sp. SCS-31]|uniref:DUF421 domain-containing protein n=1 Tax=Neobacillus oceani TaxID=3115292 RepID=UPI0039057E2B